MQENRYFQVIGNHVVENQVIRGTTVLYMHFMNLNMTFNEEVLDWIMPINTKKMCVIDSHAMLILSDNVEAF